MVSLRSSSIPLTSLSYADFDQSARRKELPLRKRAGRAVRWGKRQVSAVNQSNVGSKSRAVNVRVHTYTHTHTLTSTRRHTLKQKNTNIVFLSCREPSQQVSWQITPNLSLPLLSLPFYVIIFSVGIDLVGLERALCSAPKKNLIMLLICCSLLLFSYSQSTEIAQFAWSCFLRWPRTNPKLLTCTVMSLYLFKNVARHCANAILTQRKQKNARGVPDSL